MPITIKQLVEEVGLASADIKEVKWGTRINCKGEGIYIISLSEKVEVNQNATEFPISMNILENWIKKLGYFTIDGKETQDANVIKDRLSEFWIPDESILYIGKAPLRKNGGGIGNRVQEFYDTNIGERRPHAGGHWIKMLKNLDELHVFYIECQDSTFFEAQMLSFFGTQLSENIKKKKLSKKDPILPFANLENGEKKRKKHGLGHMKIESKSTKELNINSKKERTDMQRKNIFTTAEINDIKTLIREKLQTTDSNKQKSIRNKIRKIGFYWEDFHPKNESPKIEYNIENFEKLIGNSFTIKD